MKKVYIETFGCQMNEYDTELVRSVLVQDGYQIVEKEHEANIIMLNTCSVGTMPTARFIIAFTPCVIPVMEIR